MKSFALTSLALLCGASLPANAAGSWSPGQQLSGPKDSFAGSSAAVDPHGDTVGVWIDQRSSTGSGLTDRIQARTGIVGSALGPTSTLSVLSNSDFASGVRVYMSDTGLATAFWSTNGNIAYSDHPLGGHWSVARKISPTTYSPDDHAIAADHVGDQVAREYYDVFVRWRGAAWTAVGAPVSYGHDPYFDQSGDVLISPSGVVLDRYTAYDFHCISTHHCVRSNYRNRWARLVRGNTAWTVSSDTDLISGDAYLLDDQGRLVFATQTGTGVVVQTQPKFGGPVTTITTLPTTGKVTGFGADAAGNATVLVADAGANRTVAFVGPLGRNSTWGQQLVVPGTAGTYQPSDFKVSSSGSATLVFQSGGATPATVFAVSRSSNGAPWTAATQLSAPNQSQSIDWLAVAANNQSITTWTGVVAAVTAGFVSIHNPQ